MILVTHSRWWLEPLKRGKSHLLFLTGGCFVLDLIDLLTICFIGLLNTSLRRGQLQNRVYEA